MRMQTIRSLCVFCGHSGGSDPRYLASATTLGRALALAGVELVYGGGHLGMMGALAEGALKNGGRVVGIIPDFLMRMEAAYLEITEMVVVKTMEVRKRAMMDRSDAFCVLPGGFGTLDETFEVITQKQLGLLPKPIVFVNVGGYFDSLKVLSETVIGQGFATPETSRLYSFVDSSEQVLAVCESELTLTRLGTQAATAP